MATIGRFSSAEKGGQVPGDPGASRLWTSGSRPTSKGPASSEAPQAAPLFRAGAAPRSSPLTDRAMSPLAVQQMLKRRLQGVRVAEDPLAPLVPGPGGHGSALPERAARGRPVPGRARPPPHHPDLRPAPAARQPQPGRTDLRLKECIEVTNSSGGLAAWPVWG